MIEKKKNNLLILFSCVILLVTIIYIFSNKKISQTSNNEVYDCKYILSEYDGKLALFSDGDKIPIEIYDVFISTLPKKDFEELKKGIKISKKSELKRLIEDFTS